MAPALKVLIEIQRILRFARHSINRIPARHGVYLVALLGRKLTAWWRFWRGKLGSYGGRNSVGTEASSSGGSAVPGGYVVAASYVPPSASSHPSLHESPDTPVGASLSVDYPHGDNPHHHPLGTRGLANRSSGNLSIASIQSRASDRFSIITSSRESIRATHGQPSRLPRAASRQFGRGPDPSRSRERSPRPSSRPKTSSSRSHTPPNHPRLEVITTSLPSATHGSGRLSPSVLPSASSSYAHQRLSPPTRRQSSTIVVGVQNPSTESLPMSPPANKPPITEEPLAIESTTAHSSPESRVVNHHDELVPGSLTSSSAETLNYYLPEGRFVQLINSDQIPRYTKDALMQVQYTVLPHPYNSLQTSRGDIL